MTAENANMTFDKLHMVINEFRCYEVKMEESERLGVTGS